MNGHGCGCVVVLILLKVWLFQSVFRHEIDLSMEAKYEETNKAKMILSNVC